MNNLAPIDVQQLQHVKDIVSTDESTVEVFKDPANNRKIISKRSRLRNQYVKNEIEILQKLTHPNIVKYYGHSLINGYYRLFLNVMDFSLKDLLDKLFERNATMDAEKHLRIAMSIARGLLYLHQNKIVHRDLKPGNILLKKGCTDINICDFGLSLDLTKQPTPIKWNTGSPIWISPEVAICCAQLSSSPEQPEKMDVWALGQMLLQLYINTHGEPYHPKVWGKEYENPNVVITTIMDGKHDEIPTNKPLSEVIGFCLRKTSSERYSAAQVVEALEDHAAASLEKLKI